MPRAKAILQDEFPYNIGARCINREWFNLPMPEVWTIFCETLNQTVQKHDLKIHSFVLMSNHFHLIASTPKANISQCMHFFMNRTSHHLTRAGNRINETYAGRHYKCILHSPSYYLNAYKYNYRNPVTAGACQRVEEYPFSTLRGLLNPAEKRILLECDDTYSNNPNETMLWLNTAPDPQKLEGVRYALKRPWFKSKRNQRDEPLISDKEVL